MYDKRTIQDTFNLAWQLLGFGKEERNIDVDLLRDLTLMPANDTSKNFMLDLMKIYKPILDNPTTDLNTWQAAVFQEGGLLEKYSFQKTHYYYLDVLYKVNLLLNNATFGKEGT